MSLEKVSQEVNSSLNSVSSIYNTLSSVSDIAKKHKSSDVFSFHSTLNTLSDIFLHTETIEPTTNNMLGYLFGNHGVNNISPQTVLGRISIIKKYVKDAKKKISVLGCSKLVEGGSVFVFGGGSFLSGALTYARSSGKKFEVNNTEMRPGFHGRKFAGEISKSGIKVTHHTDNSLKNAMCGVDVVFSDCVAILTNGCVVGTTGFELVADTAANFGIPVYVFAPSWKINRKDIPLNGYTRSFEEIWRGAPKGIKTKSNLFDFVDPHNITGIISELGIYLPDTFIEETTYENMWGV